MKRIITIALATTALVACTKENTLQTAEKAAITFENAFVDNTTKATDLTTDNITNFGVYASVKNSAGDQGLILTNEPVSGSKASGYSYTNTQYWVPNATYSFVAIAPHTEAHWKYTPATETNGVNAYNGVISFDNVSAAANQDVIFASHQRSMPSTITSVTPVSLTFNHILSRVRLTFINAITPTANISLQINNVKITNAYEKGTLEVQNGTVASSTWTVSNKTLSVPFANNKAILAGETSESTEHHYFIPAPAETKYNVTFDVTIYQAGVELGTYNRTASVKVTMSQGASYDIKASLTTNNVLPNALQPITFTVDSVNNWDNWTDVTGSVPGE